MLLEFFSISLQTELKTKSSCFVYAGESNSNRENCHSHPHLLSQLLSLHAIKLIYRLCSMTNFHCVSPGAAHIKEMVVAEAAVGARDTLCALDAQPFEWN